MSAAHRSPSASFVRSIGVFSMLLGALVIAAIPFLIDSPGFLWNSGIYTDLPSKIAIGVAGITLLLLGLKMVLFPLDQRILKNCMFGLTGVVTIVLLAALVPTATNSRAAARIDSAAEIESVPLRFHDNEIHRFLVLGDTAHRSSQTIDLMETIATDHDRWPFEAALLLGDVLDGRTSFDQAMVNQFLEPYGPLLDRQIRHFLTLGNHEHVGNYVDGAIRHRDFNMGGRNYYARSFADNLVTVFFLDSERLMDHPSQMLWFRDVLRSSDSQWKILCIHHTIMGSDVNRGPNEERYRALAPIIHGETGIDLVLSGHNHFYERMNKIDQTLFVTAGNGSNPWDENEQEMIIHPQSAHRQFSTRGYVVLTIGEDILGLQAVDEFGKTFDEVTLTKRPRRITNVSQPR